MSLFRLARRVLSDLVDPVLLLTGIIITYLVFQFTLSPVFEVFSVAFEEFVVTGSVAKSLAVMAEGFVQPVVLLGFLLSLLLYLFFAGFVVSRVWQKRTGTIRNPFSNAVGKLINVFIGITLVNFVPLLFFLLYVLYQAVPPWNAIFFGLTVLTALIWVPFTLPVVSALVIERGRGRDIVYEGLLAGRIYWWKILLLLVAGYIVSFFILGLIAGIPLGSVVYQTLWNIYFFSLSAESYYGFKHGE